MLLYLCGIIFGGILFLIKKMYDKKNSKYFIVNCKIYDGISYEIKRRYGYTTTIIKMRLKDVDELYIDHWFSTSDGIPEKAEVVIRKKKNGKIDINLFSIDSDGKKIYNNSNISLILCLIAIVTNILLVVSYILI